MLPAVEQIVAEATEALAAEPPELEQAQALLARARLLAPDDAAIATAACDCAVVSEAFAAVDGGVVALTRLLGVPLAAQPAQLQAACRKLALRLHPDKNRAPCAARAFTAVRAAVDKLQRRRSGAPAESNTIHAWRAEQEASLEVVCARCSNAGSVHRPDDADAPVAWDCTRCGTKGRSTVADVSAGIQRHDALAAHERIEAATRARKAAAEEIEEGRLRTLARQAPSRLRVPPEIKAAAAARVRATLAAGEETSAISSAEDSAAVTARFADGAASRPSLRPAHSPSRTAVCSSLQPPPAPTVTSSANADQRLPAMAPGSTISEAGRRIWSIGNAIGRAISVSIGLPAPPDCPTAAAPPPLEFARPSVSKGDKVVVLGTPRKALRAAEESSSAAGAPLTGRKRRPSVGGGSAASKRPCARLPDGLSIPPPTLAMSRGVGSTPRVSPGAHSDTLRAGSWPRPSSRVGVAATAKLSVGEGQTLGGIPLAASSTGVALAATPERTVSARSPTSGPTLYD
ncbi:hypothetical protein T492DRAFT_1056803 [Pavlovales sp. CCMP2436]|nr:hypothetical protein T492DRAFT_1056803 [Pavlovales sp. CCMP2436]